MDDIARAERERQQIPGLTALRALAILLVVGYHFFPRAVPGGFVGVDVFFVLSGYLMAQRLPPGAGWAATGRFYRERFMRIMPALLVVVAVALAAAWWWFLPADLGPAAAAGAAACALFANHYFCSIASYFDHAFLGNPFTHLWSVSLELQFYLLLPLLNLGVGSRGALLDRCAVVALGSLLVGEWLLASHGAAAYFLLPGRVWEFLAGACLCHCPRPAWRWLARTAAHVVATVAGVLLIAGSAWMLRPGGAFPGFNALPACLGALLCVAAALPRSFSWPAPVLALGTCSYALYLWHWPIWVFAGSVFLVCPSTGELLLLAGLAVLLAVLTQRWVERPVARLRHTAHEPLAFRLTLAGTAALLLLAAGLWWTARPAAAPGSVARVASSREQPDLGPRLGLVGGDASLIGSGRPRFLAWGDSHLVALLPGLTGAAARAGVGGIVIERSGSPPLFGVHSDYQGSNAGFEAYTASLQTLCRANRAQVDVVILAAHWREYAQGGLLRRADDPVAAVFPRALQATLAELVQDGYRVVVIGQAPEMPFPAFQAVRRALDLGGPPPALPVDPSAAETDALLARICAAVAGPERCAFVPIAPRLVDASGHLILSHEGLATYADGHHLAPPGVAVLQAELDALLERVFPAR